VYDAIALNTVVEQVTWGPGKAHVVTRHAHDTGTTTTYTGRFVIVTVPIGVLQLEPGQPGAIQFNPELHDARASINHIAMGSVTRVVVAFKEPFWVQSRRKKSGRGKSLAQLGFLHGRGTDLPVWWTQFPLRVPIMVGWTGGPPAAQLNQLDDDAVKHRALSSLAHHLGTSRQRLDTFVEAAWVHNWDRDPYSRGAYSYALVGGSGAAGRLARPVEQTLFFAGEATDTDGHTGTVEGALSTGRRAARGVLATLG
jgi:monoamine oxidase